MPLDFSVPIEENQSAPLVMMHGHRGDRLDVVDHGRAGVQAGDGRERRPQPGLAAPALQGVQQRRLLAADVGAGAGVHDDLQVVAGAQDVLAGVAGGVRLPDRLLQAPDDVQHLAADVDEGVVGPDRVRGDDHALDQGVRRGHHQRDVLAGARLGLVGVDHQVLRLRVVLRDEAPLHAGREAGAAPPAEPGVLDLSDHVGGRHAERLAQGVVAAALLVVGRASRLARRPSSRSAPGSAGRSLSPPPGSAGSSAVLRDRRCGPAAFPGDLQPKQ